MMTAELAAQQLDYVNGDVEMTAEEDEEELDPSLIIPVTSSATDQFIEVFPEEIADIPSSTILQVLKDEDAELNVWADAALMYMQQRRSRESSAILQSAVDNPGGGRDQKVRVLASAGIALLTQAQQSQSTSAPGGIKGSDPKEDLRSMAENRFTHASKVDTLFPMTWIGRGMLNLSTGRLDQARFFFDTTLKHCGPVLPALLGMAAVLYGEKDYKGAQAMYAKAMRQYPQKSGAATRVGFGLACYRLGQVDRAKAALTRALEMDRENVEAMVGAAILDMASLDETSKDFGSKAEKAIKMISMANLLDHSNAMVQNHLANHYFWKWTPVTGTVEMAQGSKVVKGSQNMPLDPGELVRIGTNFETYVADDNAGDDEDDSTSFRIRDAWKEASTGGLKVWKKDYDRVIALAKGAYSSTSVQEIQAESLFFLARVYHVREDIDNALKFYEKACKLAPDLSPARFGLAQVLIMQEKYVDAAAHLKLVIGTSSRATDALALLGLLEVKDGKNIQEGLSHLRKAIDLDPLNPELVVLEALALQQHQSNYSKSLERYKKAVELMKRRGTKIPYEIYTNIGVVCHETKQFDTALEMYKHALDAQDEDSKASEATLDNVGIDGGKIVLKDNNMFFGFVNSELMVEVMPQTKLSIGTTEEEPGAMDIDGADRTTGGEGYEDGEKITTTEEPSDEKPTDASREGAGNDASTDGAKDASKDEAVASTHEVIDTIMADGAATNRANEIDDAPKAENTPGTLLKVLETDGLDVTSLPFRPGDEIRVGDAFQAEVVDIESKDRTLWVRVNDIYEPKYVSDLPAPLPLFVKRENRRLENPQAISVAFNLARLHEAVGRTFEAIEIHRAIVKRNPAYVNSYLRLACISRDCGCLNECAEWLKIAATTAPGNPEVLTLIGNLHLSLCDWAPAQHVFDGLLAKKIPNSEAYSMLSLGNIYFANIHASPKRYAKHLQYSADYYKRILSKDPSNAYAANGLGTVLAEKGELFKAKEVFNRVREVQDSIADALLNLGHIYLAQKKHPEALQMYMNYMKRTEDGTVPITSKSREDDLADVELYIAFAYFDWARHTELFNNVKAAPADERYQKSMEHLQLALARNTKKDVVLRYNLCMTKLQAGNCILQKLTRNIRRTANEVEGALNGLVESLAQVEKLLEEKTSGKKIPIPTSTLQDFVVHCKANIASAKSHLADELQREEEANTERELQRLAAEAQRKEEALRLELQRDEEKRKQEEMDRKAEAKMRQVEQLRAGWQQEAEITKAAKAKKSSKKQADDDFVVEDQPADAGEGGGGLFDDSSDESDDDGEKKPEGEGPAKEASDSKKELFGDSDDDSEEELETSAPKGDQTAESKPNQKELFGDSDEESDDDLLSPAANTGQRSENKAETQQELLEDSDNGDGDNGRDSAKRQNESAADEDDGDQPKKKRKVIDDEE